MAPNSTCSWNKPFEIGLKNIIKTPQQNQLTFVLDIFPLDLLSLDHIDFSSMIHTDLPLSNVSYKVENGQLKLTYDFNETLQGRTGSISFSPSASPLFFATPTTNLSFVVEPTNNLPAVVYDNTTYLKQETIEKLYQAMYYGSYGIMAVGLTCDKIIGIELMGLLQLAHLATS